MYSLSNWYKPISVYNKNVTKILEQVNFTISRPKATCNVTFYRSPNGYYYQDNGYYYQQDEKK